MADRSIYELVEATQVQDPDLLVMQQSGTAKKVSGKTLNEWLLKLADGHGGIRSIAKTGTSGLIDKYRITLADDTFFDYQVKNGREITSFARAVNSPISGYDRIVVYFNDGTTESFQVKQGTDGKDGINAYCWVKYAAVDPQNPPHSIGDIPDNWIGVYSGPKSVAPTSWEEYKWFEIKGEKGDQGIQGKQGPQGVPGPQGKPGDVRINDNDVNKRETWSSIKSATSFANALKDTRQGTAITADMVSPVEHQVECRVESINLASTVWSEYKHGTYSVKNFNLSPGKWTVKAELVGTAVTDCIFAFKRNNDDYPFAGQANVINLDGSTKSYTFNLSSADIPNPGIAFYGGEARFNEVIANYHITISKSAEYTPYVPDLSKVTVTRCGSNLASNVWSDYHHGRYSVKNLNLSPGIWYVKAELTGIPVTDALFGFKANHNDYPFEGMRAVVDLDGVAKSYTLNITAESFPNPGIAFYGSEAKFNEVMANYHITISKVNEYAPYNGQIYSPTIDGSVSGIKSISPNMMIVSNTVGVAIKVEYNIDTNLALSRLQKNYNQKFKFVYDNANVRSINHRGFNSIAPENTLSAFKLSREHGFYSVETDISFTSDGVPVLLHDNTIDRTSNGTGTIGNMTFDNVRQYDFGSWKSPLYKGEKIPSLEEFLRLCKNLGIHPYLELKVGTEAQIQNCCNIVEQCGMRGKVTWISFYKPLLNFIKDYDSEARLGLLCQKVTETVVSDANLLKNNKNNVFIDAQNPNQNEINLCINAHLPLEVWLLNAESDIVNANAYISGFTTDAIVSGQLLMCDFYEVKS